MKRLVLVAVVLVVTATFASAVEVWIDRVEENGRILVPLRGVFEAAGAAVEWRADTQTILMNAENIGISMVVGSEMARVNGELVYLDVPPRNIGGRVHIPLRFAGEALGRTVNYRGDHVVLSSAAAPDIVLLITGEATGYYQSPAVVPTTTTPGMGQPPTITSPRPGDRVPPRCEVYGTAPGGSMIVVNTVVRAQNDDGVLKTVPGLRHKVPADGNWHVAVACPELPPNIAEPLYYVIKAYYETPSYRSPEVSVKVYRAE